jgi:hypothetical protein
MRLFALFTMNFVFLICGMTRMHVCGLINFMIDEVPWVLKNQRPRRLYTTMPAPKVLLQTMLSTKLSLKWLHQAPQRPICQQSAPIGAKRPSKAPRLPTVWV